MGERSHLPTLKYHHGIVAHEILDAEKPIHTFFSSRLQLLCSLDFYSRLKEISPRCSAGFPPCVVSEGTPERQNLFDKLKHFIALNYIFFLCNV